MLLIDKIDLYKDGNKRNLFIYEGPSFDPKNNPLIIFGFDGHNLFGKEYSSYGTSWKVNEVLESLGIHNYLVFGVQCQNGMERIAEYSPVSYWSKLEEDFSIPSKPYGIKHIDSINNILIPYIEKKYSFKLENTKSIMMGSSMGGIMTVYYSHLYPQKFTSYMAMSPAFWANSPEIFDVIASTPYKAKLYMDMGGKESSFETATPKIYIDNFEKMKGILKGSNLKTSFFPIHEHSELYWNKRLPEAIKWLVGESAKTKQEN